MKEEIDLLEGRETEKEFGHDQAYMITTAKDV